MRKAAFSLAQKTHTEMRFKMNWEKLNINEIEYFCNSNIIDFDCYPFSYQIESIVQLFFYYGITKFDIDDIKEFYHKMQIPNPRADGIRKPSPSQIRKALDRLNNVQQIKENSYEILYANIEIYEKEIKLGYEQNKIM